MNSEKLENILNEFDDPKLKKYDRKRKEKSPGDFSHDYLDSKISRDKYIQNQIDEFVRYSLKRDAKICNLLIKLGIDVKT